MNGLKVVQADVYSTNGNIHVIDGVFGLTEQVEVAEESELDDDEESEDDESQISPTELADEDTEATTSASQ